jgi:ABC-type histidine transport system ATPase subunit
MRRKRFADPDLLISVEQASAPVHNAHFASTWAVRLAGAATRLDVMRGLAEEGMTMLVVTHEIGFAREAADRVVLMDGGMVLESGPPQQVLLDPQHERTRAFLSKVL